MFVRTKKSSRNQNTYVQIVESYRENGKTKQRMIRHIGTAKTDEDLARLKQIAETIKAELEFKNLSKPKKMHDGQYGKELGKLKSVLDSKTVHLSQLEEAKRCILGIHDIYGYIYDLIDFTNPFPWPKRREYAAKLLKQIVLGRIACPCSKRSTVAMLKEDFNVALNLDNVYQMMDKIDDSFCDRIQDHALAATLRLTGGKLKVLFYDATTLYFESFTEDDLKQKGYSKDMKFNQPQVLLALFVTKDGLPVGYEVFPGAKYEGHTLKPVLEKLKNRYQIDEMIFVADRGMLSEDNLNYLEDNNIPYIVGARLKSLTKNKQKEILDWSDEIKQKEIKSDTALTHSLKLKGNKQIILSYREERARKDAHDREKSILKLQEKLSKSKNLKTVISNYGYQKYLKVEGEATLVIDEDKLNKESSWDGIMGVFTNQSDLNETDVLNHYRSLWQVEESFRINKHDLSIRPIYHWTPKRIKAHIAISFMAFACVRHLEYRVKSQYKKLSPEAIRKILLKVQSSIIKNKETGEQYLFPSKISTEAKHIYRVIGAKPTDQIKTIL